MTYLEIFFGVLGTFFGMRGYFERRGIRLHLHSSNNEGLSEVKPIKVYHNCNAKNFSKYAIDELKKDIDKKNIKSFFIINTISPIDYYNDFNNVIYKNLDTSNQTECKIAIAEFKKIIHSEEKDLISSYESLAIKINKIISEYSKSDISKKSPSINAHFPLFNKNSQNPFMCIRIHVVDDEFSNIVKNSSDLAALYFFRYILNNRVNLFFIKKNDIFKTLGHLEKFSNDYVLVFYKDPTSKKNIYPFSKSFVLYDYFKNNEVLHYMKGYKSFRKISKKERNNYALFSQFSQSYNWANGNIIENSSNFFTFEMLI